MPREAAALQSPAEHCTALSAVAGGDRKETKNERFLLEWTAGASFGATPVIRNTIVTLIKVRLEIAPDNLHFHPHLCGSSGKIRKGIILLSEEIH